jgi:hypothetical protein
MPFFFYLLWNHSSILKEKLPVPYFWLVHTFPLRCIKLRHCFEEARTVAHVCLICILPMYIHYTRVETHRKICRYHGLFLFLPQSSVTKCIWILSLFATHRVFTIYMDSLSFCNTPLLKITWILSLFETYLGFYATWFLFLFAKLQHT